MSFDKCDVQQKKKLKWSPDVIKIKIMAIKSIFFIKQDQDIY